MISVDFDSEYYIIVFKALACLHLMDKDKEIGKMYETLV